MTVNTTGVLTDVHCTTPSSNQFRTPTDGSTNWTLTSTLGQGKGCNVTQTIDVTISSNQYGVQSLPQCSFNGDGGTSSLEPFAPVFFWFYTILQSGPQARGIFCNPQIETHNIEVTVDGATNLLTNVIDQGKLDLNANNVTSGSFAGKAFNGYVDLWWYLFASPLTSVS